APNDYPESLSAFMHRRIWTSTLGAVERQVAEECGDAFFAKPAGRRKNFTGRLFASIDDFRDLGNVSRAQEVWCSEPVTWLSEYRVYVAGTRIVSIDAYAGDSTFAMDSTALDAALAAFHASGEAPSAYGIDFGVLATGETALVEANDGFALGAYK